MALYLQEEFIELNVDFEYNRNGTMVKKLKVPKDNKNWNNLKNQFRKEPYNYKFGLFIRIRRDQEEDDLELFFLGTMGLLFRNWNFCKSLNNIPNFANTINYI